MNDTPDKAPDTEDAETEGAENASATKGRRLGRKGLIAVAAGVLAVLGAGYAGAGYFGLVGQGGIGPVAVPQAAYYDLPEMVVNLSASDQRAQYLKLKVALETRDSNTLRMLEPVMPRVLDMFQLYLRELRTSDLEGSAAVFRLKEELLRRINVEIHPASVDRVLFKEIIVQ